MDHSIDLFIDSEYSSASFNRTTGIHKPGFPISVQVSFGRNSEDGCHVYWNRNIVEGLSLGNTTGLFRSEKDILYDPNYQNPFDMILNDYLSAQLRLDSRYQKPVGRNMLAGVPSIDLTIYLHYSPKDLEYLMGFENVWMLYARNMITQRKGLRVETNKGWSKSIVLSMIETEREGFKYEQYRIVKPYSLPDLAINLCLVDTYAYAGMSLADMSRLVGSKQKTEIQWDKSDMLGLLKHDPDLFRLYALNDVVLQEDISMKYPAIHDKLFRESIPALQSTHVEVRSTMGSNVASKLAAVIENQHPDLLDTFAKIEGGYKSLKDPVKTRAWYQLSACNSARLAAEPSTAAYAAIIYGGRCRNEMPWITQAKDVLDVDMSGCYSSALRTMTYPIGLPTVYAQDHNQYEKEPMTLGEFIKSRGSELIDDLWLVVVDGKTSFAFDLIPSFHTTPAKIKASIKNDDDEERIRHIDGDFSYYNREVVNGVITSSIWKLIQAVASNAELSEIKDFRVKTAVYYPKSERKETVNELLAAVSANPGRIAIINEKGRTITTDDRNRSWFGMPLSELIDPWFKARKEWKAKSKDESLSVEERQQADAYQNHIKLGCNSIYGVLVSPYFKIGNVVVGNSITANARVGMWMMSKALGCFQSITDGGTMSINRVRSWSGYKPSFAVFAEPMKWSAKRGKTCRTIEVLEYIDNDWNKSIANHLENFWGGYGLRFPFEIECKQHKDDAGRLLPMVIPTISLMNKADYMLCYDDNTTILRKRGYKEGDESEAPAAIMSALATGNVQSFDAMVWEYEQSQLCRVSTYPITTNQQPGVMPGDEITGLRRLCLRPVNLTFDDSAQSRRWIDYWSKAKRGLELLVTDSESYAEIMRQLYSKPWRVLEDHRAAVQNRVEAV